ncbi:HD domain-containing phosphohydrolase [Chloroflexota bacterium]
MSNSDNESPNKYKNPLFIIMATIGVLATVVCVFFFWVSIEKPYIGAILTLNDDGNWIVDNVDSNGLADQEGIRAEDKVKDTTIIKGKSLSEVSSEYAKTGFISPRLITYLEVEGGLSVSTDLKPTDDQILETITLSAIALAFLLIGIFVFVKKPLKRSSNVFFLTTLATGVIFSSVVAAERGIAASFEIEYSFLIVLPWMVAHLFWIFPVKKAALPKYKWVEYLFYLPCIIMLILFFTVGNKLGQSAEWFTQIWLINLAAGLLLGIGTLFHSYITATFVRIKQQSKIMFGGMVLAILPILILFVLSDLVLGRSLVQSQFATLPLLFIPISIGYTIVRYQLMDIDLVIRRSIAYGLLTIGLIAIYSMIFWGTYNAWGTSELMISALKTDYQIAIYFCFAVAGLLAFSPITNRLRALIDQKLYKDRYDYKQAIRAISLGFSATTDIGELSRFLIVSITQTLGLSGACLLTPNDKGKNLSVVFSTGKYEAEEDQKALAKIVPKLKEDDLFPNQAPPESNTAFVIPLRAGKTRVGILCLDNKVSRAQLSADDLLFLHTLSSEAAITLQSFRLLGEVKSRDKQLEKAYHELEKRATYLEKSKQELEAAYHNMEESKKHLEEAYLNMARTLVLLQESRDKYTGGHSKRVAQFARTIGNQMGMDAQEMRTLELAANLHDIAKIAIPDRIFKKEGPLDPQEKSEVQLHPSRAVELLRFLDFMEDALPIIEHHHEWYNGNGYPNGLKGDDIPMGARILAVVDTFDAMTSDRPYRSALSAQEAIDELRQLSGAQWDPKIVESFISAIGMAGSLDNK